MKTLATIMVMLCVSTISAATLWVPLDYPTIQRAIDESHDGDVVIVSPGRYLENINFLGKAIVVRGTNPLDSEIVQATIIDARGVGSAVTFESNEPNTAVLTGFTITGGKGSFMDNEEFCVQKSPWGGGILCNHASPTITRNRITGNDMIGADRVGGGYQPKGGGIACYGGDAVIAHNVICDNRSFEGGGLCIAGNALACNNLVYDNTAGLGGGVNMSSGELINNTIVANHGSNVCLAGPASAINNIICSARSGAGLYLWVHDTLEALLDCVEVVEYNNVWGNPYDYRLQAGSTDLTGLLGNISVAPHFLDPNDHDYHLAGNSPCIDAGDPNTPVGKEPQPNGQRINLGAYGGTDEASTTGF